MHRSSNHCRKCRKIKRERIVIDMNRAKLIQQIKAKQSFLCVGLDPDIEKMPESLGGDLFEFNKRIIDATAPYSIAFKPNLAFYECGGLKGYKAFEDTVNYIKKNYPDIFIIADAKRGDIGNTSKMYAKSFFEELDIDALTVAPYMGEDSLRPFLEFADKWTIILALTSNKGSQDFQLLMDSKGERLFETVLKKTLSWGNDENTMYVVGATQGEMFKEIRKIVPNHFLLVPGVGAQGGSLADVVKYGINKDCGLLVNSSRGIIHASKNDDFDKMAKEKAIEMQKEMALELKKYGVI